MPQTRLGGYWCSGLKEQTEAATASNQFMSGLAKYISTDVTFEGIFSGTNPSGATITVPVSMRVSAGGLAGEIVICSDPSGGDGEANWISWLTKVYSKIDADCSLIPADFIPAVPLPCWKLIGPGFSRSTLYAAYKGNENDPQGPVADALARGVMGDLMKNPIPTFPGQYTGGFIGTYTVSLVKTP